MKPVRAGDWQRTSPLAVIFFLGKLLKAITQNAWQSLAPFAALGYAYQGDLVTKLVVGIVALVVVSISLSILNYWFFRFQILDDSILIRQGIVRKSQLDIKFDRIQGINTQQNVVYRYFNLVTVNFDTAGSSGNEGNLPAVSQEFADSLRVMIGEPRTSDENVEGAQTPESAALLRLDRRDIIRIGLTDRRALVVFAVLSPLFARMDDELYRFVASYFNAVQGSVGQTSFAGGALIVTVVAMAVIVLLALLSIAAAFLRYYDFRVFLDGETLRSRGGLLTRHEVSMSLGKIQTLRLEQGILMRWFARYRLTARQARSSQKRGKDKDFVLPMVTAEQVGRLTKLFLAPEGDDLVELPTSAKFIPISPYFMRTRLWLVSLLPAVAVAIVLSSAIGPASLVSLLWLVVSSLLIYQAWRRAGYLFSAEGCVRRSGLLGQRTAVTFLLRKVQRVTVSQSRYQRRKQLASLRFDMASGSVTIPYIDHATANRLRDYTLYKVESSDQAWY